jgi:hypothetical protein
VQPLARHPRLRRTAVVVVFAAGVAATVATSPMPPPHADLGSAGGTIHLDAAHPTMLTRVVASFNPLATDDGGQVSVGFTLATGSTRPSQGSAGTPAIGAPEGPVRVIVTSARPVSPGPPPLSPVPAVGAWQEDLSERQPVFVSADCRGGPCEREYWLIAELADVSAGPANLSWTVSAASTYSSSGKDYPSGAAATFTIDPPVAIAGAAPVLETRTPSEWLSFSPRAPVVARVVEVTVGAGAIPSDASAAASVEVVLNGTSLGQSRGPSGLAVNLVPLSEAGGGEQAPPTEPASLRKVIAGCVPGVPCTRQYVVSFQAPPDRNDPYTWQLAVRRLDIAGAWARPARLSAKVVRQLEIDTGRAPATAHLEGDAPIAPNGGSSPAKLVDVATATTSTDPVARLLPAPLVLDASIRLEGVMPAPSGSSPNASAGIWSARASIGVSNGRSISYVGSPMATGEWELQDAPLVPVPDVCFVGSACPRLSLSIDVSGRGTPAPTSAHWTLDVHVYSYKNVPITVIAAQATR